METIDEVILKALHENMGYKEGERVAIVQQEWWNGLPVETQKAFDIPAEVVDNIHKVFNKNIKNVELFKYKPKEAKNGADATPDLYERIDVFKPNIIFMPTPFSLTVTDFRLKQCAAGSRLASMPGFTLDLFEPRGPMDIDYHEVKKSCEKIAEQLRKNRYIKVIGDGTNMQVEVNPNLIHQDTGLFVKPGDCGNLPAGEVYFVPGEDSCGYFTVPAGWGGKEPLKYTCKFYVENGKITNVKGAPGEAQEYINRVIKPIIFGGENHNIFAELGRGTNPAITMEYIKKHGWNGLTAEKIIGTAHFANGGNKGMGGPNDVQIHIDWVVPNVTIEYVAR